MEMALVPRALLTRVRSFLQVAEASEALLLEELGEQRALVRRLALRLPVELAVPVALAEERECECEYDAPREQQLAVYVAERRLEHDAIREALDAALERQRSDRECRLTAVEQRSERIGDHLHELSESVHGLRMQIEGVEGDHEQLRDEMLEHKVNHVTAAADLSVLRTRVDHIENDLLTPLSSQEAAATEAPADAYLRQLEGTLQQVQREKLTILENLADVEERCRDELERVHCKLEEAYENQKEQYRINIALHSTITSLREKNTILARCVRSRQEQLQQFLRRIRTLID